MIRSLRFVRQPLNRVFRAQGFNQFRSFSRLFVESHEWVTLAEGDIVTVGITDHAQEKLGEITFVDMPVSGKIVEINSDLSDAPEKVNDDPYGSGWMVKVEISNKSELDSMMDEKTYQEFCEKS